MSLARTGAKVFHRSPSTSASLYPRLADFQILADTYDLTTVPHPYLPLGTVFG